MALGDTQPATDHTTYQPSIQEVRKGTGIPDAWKSANPEVLDLFEAQLEEWFKIDRPHQPYSQEELQEAIADYIDNENGSLGNWVYYPWLNKVIRVLDYTKYKTVRTSRNQFKITPEEQDALSNKTVGVVGLSVGQAAAVTLAMESIGGTIRIADFDTLDLSNLNRLRAGLHQLGMPKTVIAAREIAQIDPYVNIEVFPEGIHPDNAQTFMQGLDLLVEECDALPIKVLLRKMAAPMRIPVIMDTSDRGMVDVERFDLEPQRPVFHGRIQPWEGRNPAEFTEEDKRNLLFALVDYEKASERAKLSFAEIGKKITTWPQLASSVNLGGAMMAETARRILLGHDVRSGRFYVDLEELIGKNE